MSQYLQDMDPSPGHSVIYLQELRFEVDELDQLHSSLQLALLRGTNDELNVPCSFQRQA